MTQHKILLVDDEPAFRELASRWLVDQGYHVTTAGSLDAARDTLITFDADLVLLDLSMPPHFDPQITLAAMADFEGRPVIIITGHADRDLALKAVALGAWDFIAKPIDPDMLAVVVRRAITKTTLERELNQLKQASEQPKGAASYIGHSASAQKIRALIERIAPTDVRVLVTGPSGTGKEVISRGLHDLSHRSAKPFISVHCGAIPEDLLESELFGYSKGAFTGADKDKAGLLSLSDGGTLFLDEIGEMPLAMQVKLLRVLQEGTFFPVGGREQKHIDVRVISATNADLLEKVRDGSFREDLYYRIKGVNIETQPLAERLEDVPVLLQAFLSLLQNRQARQHKQAKQPPPNQLQLSPEAMQWFRAQTWPGNVRELKNTLESVASICSEGQITLEDIQLLYPHIGQATEPSPISDAPLSSATLDEQVKALEIRLIHQALEKSQDNRTQAAKQLGISRQGLLKKIERYGL
ncbi:sigma-54-dependent transcriptional regulator [Oceanospirillum linum]|uniref:Sigma-54-dependent Fis family transcriptional regulator n=1 Tax=Oceanospirillum linum TaxID=966 RepID=A0A1T1HBP3_OCELI|nr:sigma-54 dependent transcriptional regulator [Oceanospirillum linum]OOV87259.1 sigma-54-dependent Fis family transcriptional regulator [Oceanospirillum linum]SEF79270.1 two-component system, NtrC family, response regulator [Oleiphilus messinensis]SMP18442.1 two-component system, NtrC family, response regulator [Oceanospirillum linum]